MWCLMNMRWGIWSARMRETGLNYKLKVLQKIVKSILRSSQKEQHKIKLMRVKELLTSWNKKKEQMLIKLILEIIILQGIEKEAQ